MSPAFRALPFGACTTYHDQIRYVPNTDNASHEQKESYHLTLLNLNLGKINRKPVIGGNVKFPSWIRNSEDCVVLLHVALRNGAHIISLLEASDGPGGIQKHEEIAKNNAMLGMVVHTEIASQSISLFVRGIHTDGNFIELLF